MFHFVELRTEDHIEWLFGGCLTVVALNLIHLKVLSSGKITYFLQWLGVQSLHFLQNSNLLLFIDFVRVSFFATHKFQSQWSPSRIVHSLTFFSSSGYSFFISTHDMKGYIYIFFFITQRSMSVFYQVEVLALESNTNSHFIYLNTFFPQGNDTGPFPYVCGGLRKKKKTEWHQVNERNGAKTFESLSVEWVSPACHCGLETLRDQQQAPGYRESGTGDVWARGRTV